MAGVQENSSGAGLTTFPAAYRDEPQQGIIPSLLSKVRQSFVSPPPPPPAEPRGDDGAGVDAAGGMTEAQAIAQAVMRNPPRRPPPPPPPAHSPASSISQHTARTSLRNHTPPDRQWRPPGATPAEVTVSAVTTTVQTASKDPDTAASPAPQAHRTRLDLASARAAAPRHSARTDSLTRVRRASGATLPDSPSSLAVAGILPEWNYSYVPGFPLAQDDTRSVRSMGAVKRLNGVSRIIRRMKGEGLSKQYWMADEHCKECYDCKSVFTAWRRKHHCRICGQIFCSRCASNIIGARRFGQEGVVRVCNLCLQIMEQVRDDDDDDRRSITSVATSVHRYPSISDRAFLDAAAISPEMSYVKSPFAASQLFTSHPNESLTAIDESSVPTHWGAADLDRPYTPHDVDMSDGDDGQIWAGRPQTAAPFRRPMEEEQQLYEHDQDAEPTPGPGLESTNPRIEFSRTYTASSHQGHARSPMSAIDDPNHPLIGLRTRVSQAGLTALLDSERSEGLWRARSHSFAKQPEMLSGASLHHFQVMLAQAISRADLPKPHEWHRVLSNLILKVPLNLAPNVRGGDDMDVRAYVKIKKVPGGKIDDSEYVDGIVITKNVAHKAMSRRLVNPRIMVVTFPLDYHRVDNQFMSLDPILAQEKDYLRLLTKRIIDARPHIVIAQSSVSRIALDYLLDANVALARNVKDSAIHQVARCTQADVVASMDRLVLEPRMGRCAELRIQSFDHELIPGRRKTLMRFEGASREQGCTIVLRGADLPTLRKVKVITDFMALIAYHLKNEMIMYNDEHNIVPPGPPLPVEYQDLLGLLEKSEESKTPATPTPHSVRLEHEPDSPTTPTPNKVFSHDDDDDRLAEKRDALEKTRRIAASLHGYLTTTLSASAAIRFPPPAILAKMAELDRKLVELRLSRDEAEAAQILEEETKVPDPPKIVNPHRAGEPDTVYPTAPFTVTPESSLEVSSSAAMSAIPASALASMVTTKNPVRERDPYRVLRKPDQVARESAIAQLEHAHEEQYKLWQWHTRRYTEPLRPENYQGIIYLSSLGCEGSEKPCIEPFLEKINFYQPGDKTVGQFLQDLALSAADRCTVKTCERLVLYHFRVLVHGDRRLQIAMDQFPCPSVGHEDEIITWSYCRECGTPSPTTIMRQETWRMSWGAYLEHCFYPPETRAGFTCPHDAIRDQIRYFAHRNLAIRIHNEAIDLYEPVRPSIKLQVKAETKVVLKNREYESALGKTMAFFDSVEVRLKSIDVDAVQLDKVPLLQTALENMLARSMSDREEMVNLLNRTYKLTPVVDVLAINTVLRTLQDKVVQWDMDFSDIEKAFMPTEKDLKKIMNASHLKRLFATTSDFGTERSITGLSVAEVEEKEPKDELSARDSYTITEPPTPTLSNQSTAATPTLTESITLSLNSDTDATPLAETAPDHMLTVPRDSDGSDSTVGNVLKDVAGDGLADERQVLELGAVDDELQQFVSRLPRRSAPAPSIADLVQRFNEATPVDQLTLEPSLSIQRPRSGNGSRRQPQRTPEPDGSDSDHSPSSRPRLRRGRTEQLPNRHREASKPGLISDGDRSYATNASRVPSSYHRHKSIGEGMGNDYFTTRPSMGSRAPSFNKPSPQTQSGRSSPKLRQPIPMTARQSLFPSAAGKPHVLGKGKMPRPAETDRLSPSVHRTPRRGQSNSSRVTSIARHFDRLSREAEKERQKRITAVRGKRARPVGVTKAKVQVFDNLRDAFRDEFDTDSSEADNEEDDVGSDDSVGSAGQPEIKAQRRSSPAKVSKPPILSTPPPSEPMPVPPSPDKRNEEQTPLSESRETPAQVLGSSTAGPSMFSDARSEISFTDRLQIELPSFETSAPLPSHPATPHMSTDTTTADEALGTVSASQASDVEIGTANEKSSLLKSLSGLWAFRAADFTPLEYPLSASEHIFADSRVIIRETEPTSIIAFTLSSKTYREKSKSWSSSKDEGKYEPFMSEDAVGSDRASMWDVVSLDEVDDTSKSERGTHLKYDFESGASTIFCRIFFAEQFAALRKACECEDGFIESLARCVQFDAAGGKSGSAFLKTRDDRFIAKEITRLEMDALTKFAPAYFDYTLKAFQGQRPTVLAKIYGFFKIGYNNAITGKTMKMNVLIMENLFYERRFAKIYDLKGSTRNRLIQSTGRVNEVLLDENLMEIIYKHPLYLRDQSKRILRTALFNDTLFLSNLNVMDYSLVVGADMENHELVVGIVDYIRTFTWDKKLESWVKDLGAGGKGEPTIVTPKQYKLRFRTAMERYYFLAVSDRWSTIQDEVQMEEDGAAGALNATG